MSFQRNADEKIKEAIARGEFDNLPGKGKPLNLDAYFATPGGTPETGSGPEKIFEFVHRPDREKSDSKATPWKNHELQHENGTIQKKTQLDRH